MYILTCRPKPRTPVDGRLTAISRQVMKRLHPNVAWKGSYWWRRRFCKRFRITQRRKTNCKNKTWQETEPVLLRYLRGLRRRLQLEGSEDVGADEYEGVEPEPEPMLILTEHEEAEIPGDVG